MHEALKTRVESIIKLALAIVTPLSGDSLAEEQEESEHRNKRVGLEVLKEGMEV